MATIDVPAPVGGINAAHSYVAFPITDAVYLYDMIPRVSHVETAPPSELFYDDAASVAALMPYESDSSAKLLGTFGSGTSWAIKDITTGTASTLFSGSLNGRFITCMFDKNMVLCNGVGTPVVYNGTTIAAITGTAAIMSDIRGVITFKGRAYYWQLETQSFWYAEAGAFQGTLTEFPVDTLTSSGGKIVLLTTFTRDGGEGADDLFVICMDTGEVLIYQGDDPSSAVAWELVGKFQMPRPIGPRSALRVGAQTLILTEAGIVDIQRVLAGNPYPLVSAKIESWLSFKLLDLTQAERDQITMIDVPETRQIAVLHLDLCDGAARGWVSAPLCMTKDSGAWSIVPFFLALSAQGSVINCAATWQGRTYFGRDTSGAVYVIAPEEVSLLSGDENIVEEWTPESGYGLAFAPTIDGTVQSSLALPMDSEAVGAFVQPFNGLFGLVTAVLTVKGTVQGCWDNKDQVRWYKSVLRVKRGGRR